MNKIILLIFLILIVSGCNLDTTKNTNKIQPKQYDDLIIYTYCKDQVICYYHPEGFAGGLGCFRDDDLVIKYCVNG